MAGTPKRIAGPAYLAASAANVYTPPNAAVYALIRHIHIANVTGGAITFTLYVGATGASAGGTEIAKAISVPANSVWDWYGAMRMDSTDFLTGLASAASSLTIVVEGEYAAV